MIKILKDYAAGKAGDIIETNFPGGDEQEYIDNGFIEIIEDKKSFIEKAMELGMTKAGFLKHLGLHVNLKTSYS